MRNRLIKADFWSDEDLGQMARDVRLLFIGLWNYADDWGRLEERPLKIGAALFPYDGIPGANIQDWLDQLVDAGKLLRYEADGRRYLFIRRFFAHQQMRRHMKSVLPAPPGPDGLLRPTCARSEDSDLCEPARTLSDNVRASGSIFQNVSDDSGQGTEDIDYDAIVPIDRRRLAVAHAREETPSEPPPPPPQGDVLVSLAGKLRQTRGWPCKERSVQDDAAMLASMVELYGVAKVRQVGEKMTVYCAPRAAARNGAASPERFMDWLRKQWPEQAPPEPPPQGRNGARAEAPSAAKPPSIFERAMQNPELKVLGARYAEVHAAAVAAGH